MYGISFFLGGGHTMFRGLSLSPLLFAPIGQPNRFYTTEEIVNTLYGLKLYEEKFDDLFRKKIKPQSKILDMPLVVL